MIALQQKDYSKAIVHFQKVIDLEPNHTKAYCRRGVAYFEKGQLDKAIADLDQAIRLDPKYDEAYNNRGSAYARKGELDKAIADFDQAIRFDPKYAEAYNNRGLAYFKKGQLDKAIADYNQAIRFDPKYTKAYNNRGHAYSLKGDYERAILDFDQAIKLNPDSPHAVNNLAWILATHPEPQIRDGAEAVGLAEKACELTDYKNPASLDTLAAAYAETGQFDKAVKTAAKAVQLARAAKSEKIAEDIQSRLDLYKAKRPFRESLTPP